MLTDENKETFTALTNIFNHLLEDCTNKEPLSPDDLKFIDLLLTKMVLAVHGDPHTFNLESGLAVTQILYIFAGLMANDVHFHFANKVIGKFDFVMHELNIEKTQLLFPTLLTVTKGSIPNFDIGVIKGKVIKAEE